MKEPQEQFVLTPEERVLKRIHDEHARRAVEELKSKNLSEEEEDRWMKKLVKLWMDALEPLLCPDKKKVGKK